MPLFAFKEVPLAEQTLGFQGINFWWIWEGQVQNQALVPGPTASCSHSPPRLPLGQTEERVPLSALPYLLKVEHFGAVATFPLLTPNIRRSLRSLR